MTLRFYTVVTDKFTGTKSADKRVNSLKSVKLLRLDSVLWKNKSSKAS
jgi:hypothetical protein